MKNSDNNNGTNLKSNNGMVDLSSKNITVSNCTINIGGMNVNQILKELNNISLVDCDINLMSYNKDSEDMETVSIEHVAEFEKVSYAQFSKDYREIFGDWDDEEAIKDIYDGIKMPTRATIGSAGYDLFVPLKMSISRQVPMFIPTGIRCKMNSGVVLNLYPRSGLGFKYKFRLCNTVGIIDSDYYNSDNEGHIMLKVQLEGGTDSAVVERGQAIAQGVFSNYLTAKEEKVTAKRNGGFGSTSK